MQVWHTRLSSLGLRLSPAFVAVAFAAIGVFGVLTMLSASHEVQEATARLGLVTGKGLGTLIRERFPRWVLVGAVVLLASANTLNIAADLASMAAALRLLAPVPAVVGVVGFGAVIGATEVLVPYHRYSRVLRWFALSLVTYVLVLVAVDIQSAEQAARALEPLAGSFAKVLFSVGIVGLGLLAVPVLAGSTAYAVAEAFHWREGLSQRLKDAPGFYGVIVASMVIGLALVGIGVNPIRALYLSAIFNGIAALLIK